MLRKGNKMSQELQNLISKVADGQSLTTNEAELAFENVMSGNASSAQIGAFLMALRVRGETIDEITGAVTIMRKKMLTVSAPECAIDIVGTGGDAKGTHNISTCAAFVVAGAGAIVAKHGNRAISSKSGAADVLLSLGVNIDAEIPIIERAIKEANIGFMWAPKHHSAMRYVMPTRQELATRTIFNLLGPLSNPAEVSRQFTGVFSRDWVEPIAQVLKNLGTKTAWVVHGSDGMDELTTTGLSYVAELKDGQVNTFEISPNDVGINEASLDDLIGGDSNFNAAAIKSVLAGERSPLYDIVIFNAGATLLVNGTVSDVKSGIAMAADAIADGRARASLNNLIDVTNSTS